MNILCALYLKPISSSFSPHLPLSPTMAELRFQSRPWILFPDHNTTSPSSFRTIVVARMHETKSTNKSIELRKPSKKEHHSLKKRDSSQKEHHLWKKRDSAQSFQKASNLVRIVTQLPNEKEAIYGALDKWVAFEAEFPVIAVAKSLKLLKNNKNWLRIIQVCKWLFSKGQVMTWTTYDSLLVSLSMLGRIVEAELVYNKIIKDHSRSTPKKIFARMISLYDYHCLPHKILEVFADMEEFSIHPDGETTWRIARAFVKTEQPEKVNPLLEKYLPKSKYLYFDGNRVRVKRGGNSDPFSDWLKIK